MTFNEVAGGGGLFDLAPLIVLFPVLGLIINMIFGRRLGERFTGIVASGAVGLAFVVAVMQFIALQGHPEGARILVAEWIHIAELQIDWAVRVDTLSVTMMTMVTGVSALIHIYAIGYMHEDVRFQGDPGRFNRFFVYFNLFVAAMMILVSGDSYLTLFVGWEGVGLCSYLLIGFWYEKGEGGIGNAIAGKKAFITNRIGDFGFLIAMFLIFWTFGSLQFEEVFIQIEAMSSTNSPMLVMIGLFLLLGVAGKSAQLPLFVWLPDAMAGPTPVSALIHAATMVTAGVYLVARNAVLFSHAESAALWVALVGAATALFAATIAVGQFDIKRVLAYSTISQLGFMVAAVGMGAYVAGMFHLVTHAFFKALLFLGSGSVIQGVEHGHHALAHHDGHDESHAHAEEDHGAPFDPQDMRNMGGLRSKMPTTFWVYAVGALALAGIPPLAGFFSKDEILLDASHESTLIYVMLTLAAILTAFYMGRQVFMVFFGAPRSAAAEHARENPPVMTYPLIGLAMLTVLGGALNLPGLHSLANWLEHTLGHLAHSADFSISVALISTLLALVSIGGAALIYYRKPMQAGQPDPLRGALGPLFRALNAKWWVDELYQLIIIRPYIWLANFLAHVVDWRFWHDWFHDAVVARGFGGLSTWLAESFDLGGIDRFANGLGEITTAAARGIRRLQTGYVRNYAITVLLGLILMLSFLLTR